MANRAHPDTGIGGSTKWGGDIGSGSIRYVSDRKPENVGPDRESMERGIKDKGLNKQTMNESLADFNHGVTIEESD